MTELSREARLLIAQSRAGVDPIPGDRARLRAKLEPAWAAYETQHASSAGARTWSRATRFVLWSGLAWLSQTLQPGPPSSAPTQVTQAPVMASIGVSAAVHAGAARLPSSDASALTVLGQPSNLPLTAASPAPEDRYAAGGRDAGVGPCRGAGGRKRGGCKKQTSLSTALGRRSLAAVDAGRAVSSPTLVLAGNADVAAPALVERVATAAVGGGGPQPTPDASGREPSAVPARSAPIASVTSANSAPQADINRSASASVSSRATVPDQGAAQLVPASIDDELELLGAAHRALRNHQPSRALGFVQQHAFRFPRGALTQERWVVHALALCALERFASARALVAEMRQQTAQSPLLESVRRGCGF